MSHITTIKTQITDLRAVRAACEELGLVLKENQTTCAFWPEAGVTQQQACTHAIELPVGSYKMELGLVKTEKGFDLIGDELLKLDVDDPNGAFWCKRIMGTDTNPLGRNFEKLIQLYGVHKAVIEAENCGYAATVMRTEVQVQEWNAATGENLTIKPGEIKVGICGM